MNSTGPPRLLDLATQSLLRVEAWAIVALESLPMLFPPLFMEVVTGRHSETLKAMVRAWPFTQLPLGALMKAQQPHQDVLKAALDGLDVLLAQKISPRRWKLQVLDLRVNANTSFWNIRSGTWDGSSVCSFEGPEAIQRKTKRRKVDNSRKEEKQLLAPVQVLLEDLCLQKATPDEYLTFLMKWAKQRKELYLDSVFFPEGHLDQVLRCLKTPLVSLLITNCLLLESNLTYLLSYLNTSHLKYLNLSDFNMMGLSPEFLQVLLERSSATLHFLELDGCRIMDYQLTSVLPALGHRSQLTSFSFHGNPVSAATLESLLQHTVLLSKFRLGLFPVPLECYEGLQGTLDLWNLRGYLAELKLILQDLGRPNVVLLFSDSTCSYHAILLYSVT
ncbi:LOW QUALITY PROTEIN: melanoma antigen preferentially expressed in tumors-like [Dugong dugon]